MLHAVEDLVALLQAAENGDRVLDRRLVHHAPAGNGARARRPFRYTCGIRRAWSRRCSAARRGRASASRGCPRPCVPSVLPAPTMVCSSSMKRMILPSLFLTSFEHGLEPLLKLAAVLRARDQRAHIERRKWSCPSGPRARRRARCAAPGPRRWRFCRRPARR